MDFRTIFEVFQDKQFGVLRIIVQGPSGLTTSVFMSNCLGTFRTDKVDF